MRKSLDWFMSKVNECTCVNAWCSPFSWKFNWILSRFIDWNPIETQGVYVLIVTSSCKHVLKSIPNDLHEFNCLERLCMSLEEYYVWKMSKREVLPGPLDMSRCPTWYVQHPSAQNSNFDSTRGNLDMSRCPTRHVEMPHSTCPTPLYPKLKFWFYPRESRHVEMPHSTCRVPLCQPNIFY